MEDAEAAAQAAALKAYEEAIRNGGDGQRHVEVSQNGEGTLGSFGAAVGVQDEDPFVGGVTMAANGGDARLIESLHMVQQHHQQELEQQQQDIASLQDLMGLSSVTSNPDAAAQQILRLLEQQRREQELAARAAAEKALQMRPEKHYLTISEDGLILEATRTVTGFAPNLLLMKSVFDEMYDEDHRGFLCIKTHFWDKGHAGVEAYVRRKNVEGNWIWLKSKAVSYLTDTQIPGTILEESLVRDEELAIRTNRTTRLFAVLLQAVEDAKEANLKDDEEEEPKEDEKRSDSETLDWLGMLNEDAAAYQSVMELAAETGVEMSDDPQTLVQIASKVLGDIEKPQNSAETSLDRSGLHISDCERQKAFDPNSVIESVRKGAHLDLGLMRLRPEEIKVTTLVLSGRLSMEQVLPMVPVALQLGQDVKELANQFVLDSEKLSPTKSRDHGPPTASLLPLSPPSPPPPPISVLNLSCTYIGNGGIDMLSEVLYSEQSCLKAIDVSFCHIEEKGFLSFARALSRRKRNGVPPLRGVIISGNYVSARAASELGMSLSPTVGRDGNRRKRSRRKGLTPRTGYDSDSTESDDDDDDDDFPNSRKRRHLSSHERSKKKQSTGLAEHSEKRIQDGLQVLHVANASLSAEATALLLEGLGTQCTIRELNLSSNNFGVEGAAALVKVLQPQSRGPGKSKAAFPFLDRLDMSNNNLGDDGTTQLTRAISKRSETHLVDLKLSCNSIGSGGIETIMDKLVRHDIVSLSLDKNAIGDPGCQLVAASLQSMKSLARLNLGFNQIGCRGITSLMRSLVNCESVTYLCLSGNILRISGAMALAFTLSQHPRLEEVELDNCCLGQAAQCHIAAGIISNRLVPMKRLKGFAVGPPMAAIGALKPHLADASNEECFRIRKDEQMKTILQWFKNNKNARRGGMGASQVASMTSAVGQDDQSFLTPEFVSRINEVEGTVSQNAYYRLLGWLSRMPFDDDELTALQKYFYDPDGGEGERGSDGYINLKLRGDLLAALGAEAADEIRDELPAIGPRFRGSVGIDLDKLYVGTDWDAWEAFRGKRLDEPSREFLDVEGDSDDEQDIKDVSIKEAQIETPADPPSNDDSGETQAESTSKANKVKARITMFPKFEELLAELKGSATDMIEKEDDPVQQEVILTQYAEASLTILRQLRYHCMNSGLDGWRKGSVKRKILIIDDSRVTRKLVAHAFEKADFVVDTAENGKEGVEKLKESLYDIAFMDIDMPVMNGFEATKLLREWEDAVRPGARQPICALTASYVDDPDRSELMKFKEAGVDVMERKPCNIPRLFKALDDVSPMFSDLSISVMQRDRSDSSLHSGPSSRGSLSAHT